MRHPNHRFFEILSVLLLQVPFCCDAQVVPSNNATKGASNNNQLTSRNIVQSIPFEFKQAIIKNAKDLHSVDTRLLTTTCPDTSAHFYFTEDSLSLYANAICRTADGNTLISATYNRQLTPQYITSPYVLKCNDEGTVLWARRYDASNPAYYISYDQIIELRDGSALLKGIIDYGSGDVKPILEKINAYGFITWTQAYETPQWKKIDGSSIHVSWDITDIREDPWTGDIYVSGGFEYGFVLTRLHTNDGSVYWSKFYKPGLQAFGEHAFGVDIHQDEVQLWGHFQQGNDGIVSVFRIKKTDGDTLQTKYFTESDAPARNLSFIGADPLVKMNNGHVSLGGYLVGNDIPDNGIYYHYGLVEFDEGLNFTNGFYFTNKTSSLDSRVTQFPDGSGIMVGNQYISENTATIHSIQFKQDVLLKQRQLFYPGQGRPYSSFAVRTNKGSDLFTQMLLDSATRVSRIEITKLKISDTASDCLGWDEDFISTVDYHFREIHWQLDSIGINDFSVIMSNFLNAYSEALNYTPGCRQLSHCDSIKLEASAQKICSTQALELIAHKNKECGGTVFLSYSEDGIDSVTQVNDSTFSFHFNKEWSGKISATVAGCTLLSDSVEIAVLNAPPALDLGRDTSLCPGNVLQLNAHKGYSSYKWQDGSTDSTFMVTNPGTYFVETRDACGGFFYDTVLVSLHQVIPFGVGADRTKCNNDTLHFDAPAGFMNYNWSPSCNISSLTAPNVVVYPDKDTSYFVRAELASGCFVYDTVKITVHHSPRIFLGSDTSFCAGKSLLLDAGVGFNVYRWNDGSSSQTISVNKAGTYTISATTIEGCSSYDTLKVLSVWPLPVTALDHNNELCQSSTRILDPGAFSSYLWQDGSTSRKYAINTTGVYYVQVTDNRGCVNADTVRITSILPSPSGFLPNDTSICSYSSVDLKPVGSFSAYSWSNGSALSTISTDKAGEYWLRVRNSKGCTGVDTIVVSVKECMVGLRVPTAFSPNNDSRNDIFRALLFGNIKSFELTVYNRWGQIVFHTTDRFKGWDGTTGGREQDPGVFIWMCKYQLEGDQAKVEEGTVMLIR
ncbi:MAG: gliding motility-associated C-terminal domain-containing protein [Flavisolibacter sp.]